MAKKLPAALRGFLVRTIPQEFNTRKVRRKFGLGRVTGKMVEDALDKLEAGELPTDEFTARVTAIAIDCMKRDKQFWRDMGLPDE